MAVEIKVPELGESIIEATVARWMKQEGDSVAAGEPVVELETDKVNLEVGAQQAGVLEKILAAEGVTVQVGDALATVRTDGAAAGSDGQASEAKAQAPEQEAAQPSVAEAQPSGPPAAKSVEAKPETATAGTAAAASATAGTATAGTAAAGTATAASATAGTAAAATPVALRAARDLGVDIAQVKPTGAGGRVTREDVEAFAAQKTSAQDTQAQQDFSDQVGERRALRASAAREESVGQEVAAPAVPLAKPSVSQDNRETAGLATRERMTRRRQTIARRLVEAQQTAAMLTTFNEVDMSAVMGLRKRRREAFKERFGVDLGFMSFFVKATVAALREFPYLNAEIAVGANGQDEIVVKHYYDIGIAIGAEEGLVVPVVRDADALSFAGIEKAIREFVDKVKQGALTIEDLRGGTFTITNGGVYGSLMSTPILNPPQVGILGMHAIKERPVVVNGEIVVRPMMYTALSYDHRLVDGQTAVKFLVRLKEFIEDPEALLFG